MGWTLYIVLIAVLAFAVAVTAHRRAELARMTRAKDELETAQERGSHRARLQYPHVDLTRCLGCGTCVSACPEEGVLQLIHGQAIVVHGARCVGHGLCARECPTGAIVVTLGDLEERRDIPVLSESFEAPDRRGLFLAGEVTGYALIRTAIAHGTAIADEVARRVRPGSNGARHRRQNGHARASATDGEPLDLCIVGAGPAGLACALQAKAHGLRSVTLEQEQLGGTVAQYPRRKLVMTQPVELPLHGRLSRTSYQKEELMELWEGIAEEHALPVRTGVQFLGVEPAGGELHRVKTNAGDVLARNVCLALGRRGTPRKLEVPGEELPKVAYSLIDAQSYRGRRVLVVGGGDSAIEAALGLADQPGNDVTLSYRRHAFFRLKARNETRVQEAMQSQRLRVLFQSGVERIDEGSVELSVAEPNGDGAPRRVTLPNDDVFVLAGGIPPFEVLEESGVSFDPARRAAPEPLTEQGTGLLRALSFALLLSVVAGAWLFWFRDYYRAPLASRVASDHHRLLRPSSGFGLVFGVAATCLILANLAYLVRRGPRWRFAWGSLQKWMTSHVATGILALLFALLHSAMAAQDTVGGHALWGLAALVLTGAIGRYFYSFVPRAANGRELALSEVRAELARLSAGWERENRDFGERVRVAIDALVSSGHWRGRRSSVASGRCCARSPTCTAPWSACGARACARAFRPSSSRRCSVWRGALSARRSPRRTTRTCGR